MQTPVVAGFGQRGWRKKRLQHEKVGNKRKCHGAKFVFLATFVGTKSNVDAGTQQWLIQPEFGSRYTAMLVPACTICNHRGVECSLLH